mgnify:CR=1 FL=1
MPKKKFLRRIWNRYSRLGRNRKKEQKWRKPKGRDNKMREKRRGYPAVVSIGYRGERKERGKINGKSIAVIFNVEELMREHKEGKIIFLGKVGGKRKIEIAHKAKEAGIKIQNLKTEEFLKENQMKGVKAKHESK